MKLSDLIGLCQHGIESFRVILKDKVIADITSRRGVSDELSVIINQDALVKSYNVQKITGHDSEYLVMFIYL